MGVVEKTVGSGGDYPDIIAAFTAYNTDFPGGDSVEYKFIGNVSEVSNPSRFLCTPGGGSYALSAMAFGATVFVNMNGYSWGLLREFNIYAWANDASVVIHNGTISGAGNKKFTVETNTGSNGSRLVLRDFKIDSTVNRRILNIANGDDTGCAVEIYNGLIDIRSSSDGDLIINSTSSDVVLSDLTVINSTDTFIIDGSNPNLTLERVYIDSPTGEIYRNVLPAQLSNIVTSNTETYTAVPESQKGILFDVNNFYEITDQGNELFAVPKPDSVLGAGNNACSQTSVITENTYGLNGVTVLDGERAVGGNEIPVIAPYPVIDNIKQDSNGIHIEFTPDPETPAEVLNVGVFFKKYDLPELFDTTNPPDFQGLLSEGEITIPAGAYPAGEVRYLKIYAF